MVGWLVVLAGNPSVEYQSAEEEEEERMVSGVRTEELQWRITLSRGAVPQAQTPIMGAHVLNLVQWGNSSVLFFFFFSSMIHRYLRVRILPYLGTTILIVLYFVFLCST